MYFNNKFTRISRILKYFFFHLFASDISTLGVVESGLVESGHDSFYWRSTRYLAKTVESGLVESGQNKQSS